MSRLWICLSLLFVVSLLQSSASTTKSASNPAVSLQCNQTVEVRAGETVTLNCTISISLQNCTGSEYLWCNTTDNIGPNGSMKYNSEWDGLTYVSLTISDVREEENYTVYVRAGCGIGESPAINVKVIQLSTVGSGDKVSSPSDVQNTVMGVFAILVFALFLLGATRSRRIMECIRKERLLDTCDLMA